MSVSKNKEKKINKLRKAHIWPSVVFLIISLAIALIGFVAFIVVTTTLIAQERFDAVVGNAVSIGRSLDISGGMEAENVENIKKSGFTDSLFVLNKNGEQTAGFGTASYSDVYAMDAEDPYSHVIYKAYTDTLPEENLIDKDGNRQLSMLLTPENLQRIIDSGPADNGVIFEARFWLEYKLSDGGRAMIKCVAPLRFNDFDRSLIMGLGALAVMLVPIIFFFVNVIISVRHQRRTTKLLYTDAVTGGSSYVFFEHSAEKELSARRNMGRLLAVADITVMKYRSYCNYHGARAGESLLEMVDKSISAYLGKGEVCANSGKSSFAVFLKCSDKQQAEARVNMIINEVTQALRSSGIVLHAGIYFSEPVRNIVERITDPADCFNRASAARALLTDENTPMLSVYDDKMLDEQRWAHKVEERMQAALDNKEFKVYVQPKYDPVSEKLAGGEALIRWVNDDDGFIPPGRFIPIFESNGFITKIDDYMISNVARLQAEWIAKGKSVVPVSVNVSRAHFADPELAEHICSLVDKYNVPHHFIEIELTESAFFDDKAALLRTVHRLQELGFEISMDDFGAGYSSLNSLKDLPLDVLKLDADFFRGEDEENRGEIVVSQAIRLAKSLNMRIVAEGVEKKEQVDFLAGQGCDMIQGYYFAKPMPAEEYEQRLQQQGE